MFLYEIMDFKPDNVLDPLHGVQVFQNGDVGYYVYARLTMQCPMNFEDYPFDSQDCAFIGSRYTQTDRQLKTVHNFRA